MLNQRLRQGWNGLMRPIGRGLGRAGLSPDAMTLIGVAISGGVAVLIVQGRLLAAGFVAIAAAFADTFDGAIARATGRTSKFGALLDSTTDRLADALYLVPVAWLYGVDPDIAERNEPWVAAVALTALVLSFMVSYVKARAEGLGFDCNVGFGERAERLIIVIAGLILDLVPAAMVLLAAVSLITFLQRIFHVRAQAESA
ncbi:MAG: CDP-diacylglycerol---glycerol-3-phosphate 3-phosphatidyltransferase [Actinomycetota bacterium]|nr:CDP-diacylglycerol---glycerol-3-phosphate 3-phosphatidyltransferase [Actinomycetota bacterium]